MKNKKLTYCGILLYAEKELESRIKREKLLIKSHSYYDETSLYDLKDYEDKLIELRQLIDEDYTRTYDYLHNVRPQGREVEEVKLEKKKTDAEL